MKNTIFLAIFVVGVGLAVTYASVAPGPYSLNVQFIPPLVSGVCTFGQFWNPPNMTCAMCFCFTGRLSRCIPQPNCDPSRNVTTTSTTQTPGGSNPNVDATTQQTVVGNQTAAATPAPAAAVNPSDTPPAIMGEATTQAPAVTTAPTTATTAAPAGRKRRDLRYTKFGQAF